MLILAVLAAVPLACLVFIVWALWRCLVPPRRKATVPRCGRCRYSVEGATNFVCPECGGDLREVGISSPATAIRSRASLVAGLLTWWMLVGAGVIIAMGVLLSDELLVVTRHIPFHLATKSWRAELNLWHVGSRKRVMIARWAPPWPAYQLEVDINADRFLMFDPKGRQIEEGTGSKEYIATKFVAVSGYGPGSSDPIDLDCVSDLGRLLDNVAASGGDGPVFRDSPSLREISLFGNGPAPVPESFLLARAFFKSPMFALSAGLVFGLLGSWLIVRRRAAILRRIGAA